MKNKSNSTITLLCHEENTEHIMKLVNDKAFKYSLIKLAKLKDNIKTVTLKIAIVSDSNINDK